MKREHVVYYIGGPMDLTKQIRWGDPGDRIVTVQELPPRLPEPRLERHEYRLRPMPCINPFTEPPLYVALYVGVLPE